MQFNLSSLFYLWTAYVWTLKKLREENNNMFQVKIYVQWAFYRGFCSSVAREDYLIYRQFDIPILNIKCVCVCIDGSMHSFSYVIEFEYSAL